MNFSLKKLLFLQLNELNFDLIKKYVDAGELPFFKILLGKYPLIMTSSEAQYENIEPWIQWVTVHTGLTYNEHKVFRLGDAEEVTHEQIFEKIEKLGFSVGAISPMNSPNRMVSPDFYMPDPWSNQKVHGDSILFNLFSVISKLVNNNSSKVQALGLKDYLFMFVAFIVYLPVKEKLQFSKLIFSSNKKKWRKAIALDVLLFSVFKNLTFSNKTDFSTLFLNAGAHIQHHYFHNNRFYDGSCENPSWYINKENDPILEIYKCYDQFIEFFLNQSDYDFLIATALKQKAFESSLFYWRLANHVEFLSKLGLSFKSVSPRMSRDFVIEFSSEQGSKDAQILLESIHFEGIDFFSVDNRGLSLFVSLVYPKDITKINFIQLPNSKLKVSSEDFNFVAIKNGHHDEEGYLVTNFESLSKANMPVPLTSVHEIILKYFSGK